MLLSTEACRVAVETCTADDFYAPKHGHVFAAMATMFSNGEKIDPVTVAEQLNRDGVLELIGGPALLINLQAGTPATSNASRYAKIIVDHAVLRRLINAAGEIAELGYDLPDDVGDTIDRAGLLIAEVGSRRLVDQMTLPDGLWTIDEFLERPGEKRPPWVVPGMLRVGWRVMVVAGEGVGKTVLFRNIAICAAQGIHPLTHDPAPVVKTLIVDLENPDEQIVDVCQPIVTQAQKVVGSHYDRETAYLWHQPGGIDIRKRADRSKLEAVIAHVQPDLVAIGPLYKMYAVGARENDELAAGEVLRTLDDLRTRYSFALLMEHHAPKKQGAGSRDLTPYGSSLWLRWPEIGLMLDPIEGDVTRLRLGRWRGDRVINSWPKEIVRSKPWPWAGIWADGAFGAGNSSRPPDSGPPRDPVYDEPF